MLCVPCILHIRNDTQTASIDAEQQLLRSWQLRSNTEIDLIENGPILFQFGMTRIELSDLHLQGLIEFECELHQTLHFLSIGFNF